MGFRPFRALFLPRSRCASRRPLPSCRCHRRPTSQPAPNAVTRRTMVHARRYVRPVRESRDEPSSGLFSPRKSVVIRRGFRPPTTRCSLGLQPLQGLHLRAWPDGSHRASPVGLARGPFQRHEVVGSFRSAALRSVPTRRLGRSLARSTAPPEVSHLVTPLGGSKAARSELCVHFGPRATSPRSGEPSLDRHGVPAEAGTSGC
jgi:hypothetical protein